MGGGTRLDCSLVRTCGGHEKTMNRL